MKAQWRTGHSWKSKKAKYDIQYSVLYNIEMLWKPEDSKSEVETNKESGESRNLSTTLLESYEN